MNNELDKDVLLGTIIGDVVGSRFELKWKVIWNVS